MMAGKGKKPKRRRGRTMTGRDLQRKPKRAPRDKAISGEEIQDKEVGA
jgi:hypothetical protein